MPFLTKIASGGSVASYASALTETHHSMIIANYGASQGFDNDGEAAGVEKRGGCRVRSRTHSRLTLHARLAHSPFGRR